MNIDKVSSRAKHLADTLGVEFKIPDMEAAKVKAQRKIHKMKEYTTKKEQYDKAVAYIIEAFSKDDILAFIASVEVSSNPK
ncbi:hypothetical protein ACSGOQ_005481 [Escherichia coli]